MWGIHNTPAANENLEKYLMEWETAVKYIVMDVQAETIMRRVGERGRENSAPPSGWDVSLRLPKE